MPELKRLQYSLEEVERLTGYTVDALLDFGESGQVQLFVNARGLESRPHRQERVGKNKLQGSPIGEPQFIGFAFPVFKLDILKIKAGEPLKILHDFYDENIYHSLKEPYLFTTADMVIMAEDLKKILLQARTGSPDAAEIITAVYDTENIAYCPELVLALRAWYSVYCKGELNPNRGCKDNIEDWLKKQKPKPRPGAIEHIPPLINIDKKDGSGGKEKWSKIKGKFYNTE